MAWRGLGLLMPVKKSFLSTDRGLRRRGLQAQLGSIGLTASPIDSQNIGSMTFEDGWLCGDKLKMDFSLTGDGTLGGVGDLDTHGRASNLDGRGSHGRCQARGKNSGGGHFD